MFVRLKDARRAAAGKWTDAATGEHGDLLDVIRESCGLIDFADVAEEARRFLSLPHPEPERSTEPGPHASAIRIAEAARRLFAMSQPIGGTLVERICANAALRLCTEPETCASIPAATTGPTSMARPRPGRR
jgi:hypothetical protein